MRSFPRFSSNLLNLTSPVHFQRIVKTAFLTAMTALFLALVPSAHAGGNIIKTVNVNLNQCNGSLLSQTDLNGDLCWSGTNSNNYIAFSLAAMETGAEIYPEPFNGTPTLVVLNDTGSTTVSLQLAGSIGKNDPITCQGNNGSTGCAISGPLGTFGNSSDGGGGAAYGPGSTTAAWPAIVTITFYGVPLNGVVGLQWSSWSSTDESGVYLGGQVPSYGDAVSSCSGNPTTTTVTGTVYVPNGTDPLPNALVYIPYSAPGALTEGVQCLTNSTPVQGLAVTSTYSAVDGTFTLTGVPTGTNIPIVVQSGKWRVQRVISTVTACANTKVPAKLTTLPSNQYAGDIPMIALVTGAVDATECVLRKTGIVDSEFTDPNGTGRIHFYTGTAGPGVNIDSSTPSESTLVANATTLNAYDMIMLPCQGTPTDSSINSTTLANLLGWADAGGRLFTTHYSYAWLYGNPNTTSTNGFDAAADWHVGWDTPASDPGMATVNMAFAGGSTLANWLQLPVIGGSTTLGQIEISTLRLDQNGVISPTQSWLTLDQNTTDQTGSLSSREPAHPVMQMTFNTPVGAPAANQCGRVLFNDYHVYNASGLGGQTFPSECNTTAMSPQEHMLEYALFDLSNVVTPVVAGTVSESFVNSPTTLTQGDTADQIAIAVTNTSSTIGLDSSLVVSGALPQGVTVNTSSFSSGGWDCTSPGITTFTCTRTAALAAGAEDTIDVPVAVASNAPTGASGSLISTIAGGGLATNLMGTDPLTIQGRPAITWSTPSPIVYGTPLSATQLDATATCAGSTVAGTYAYTYGSNPISAGTVLPAGSDTLTVTFTPSTITASCPVQTTTVVETVNPAPLVVTANNFTRTYGAANPTLTDAITGFVNGDTPSSLTGSAIMSTTAITSSPVGSYPISFSTETLANPNYSITYVAGSLSVTKGPGAITWTPPAAIAYGTPLGSTQLDAYAACAGSTVAGIYSYTPASGTIPNAGAQTLGVIFTPTDTVDCPVETTTVPLTVKQAPLVVTAVGETKTYNTANPTLTDTITGFVNGDTTSNLTGSAIMSTTAITSSPVGSYPITFSTQTLANPNYSITYVPATLSVTQATGAINWPTPAAISYGTPLSAVQLDATATCNGQTVTGTMAYTPASGTVLNAGTTNSLSVTFTPSGNINCIYAPATVTLPVNKDVLTVTANNQSMNYGGTVPTLTDAVTGFVNGDTSAVVSGTATMSTTGTSTSPASSYPITFSTENLTAGNYTFNYVPGTLAINHVAGAINWPTPAAISYGTPLSPVQLDATATCNNQTVTGTMAYTPASGTVLNAGTTNSLSVTFTPNPASSCTFATTSVKQVVIPAVLLVTANNQTRLYNTSNPTLTDTITGFVNGDTAIMVSGNAALNTTVTTSSLVGSYPNSITAAQGTLSAGNYTFAFAPGSFTVTSPMETITWPAPSPINYGSTLTGLLDASVTSATSTIPGTCTYKNGSTIVTASTVLPAGIYTLTAICVPTDATDYTTQTTTVPLTVNKDILTVTANNLTKTYGSANPTLTDAITGFVNGDTSAVVSGSAALGTTAATTSPVGSYPVTSAQGTLSASNYTFNFVPGTLSVTKAAETITWPTPGAITYGTALGGTQLDANVTSGGVVVLGTYAYTPAAGTVLPAGTQTLSVTFTPTDTTEYSVEMTTVQIIVNKPGIDTAVVMTFSNTVWTYPGEANITVCVTPATNVAATGSVQIFDGSTLLTTQQLLGGGCAYWYITPGLSAGTHVLTAVYSGDKNNPAGVSAPSTITVALAPTTMEASCWNSPNPYGANYLCNANTDSGPKSGYMTYSYDGGKQVVLPLNSNGATVWSINLPPVGTHTLLIAYPQQGNYQGATLPVQTFVVTPAPVIVALTPSSWYLNVGTSLTFTAVASSSSVGSPKTGSVLFYDDTTLLSTVPVNAGGTAVYSTSSLAAGTHIITATYAGGANYATASSSITISTVAATPQFSEPAGNYTATQTVALITATPGAAIYYTFNGTPPTTASAKYTSAIKVSSTTTITAMTAAKGYKNSAVATSTYTITPVATAPIFSLAVGTYLSARTVTISDATAGATIYYTTNGRAPTTSSTRYTGAITVSETETLQAITVASGFINSAIASAKFTIK